MANRDNMIQFAVEALENREFNSVAAAARAFNVPRSTLRDRIDGRTNRRESHQHEQRLTARQEEMLANWIIEQDFQGLSPTHARVRQMAARITEADGDPNPRLGNKWVQSFLRRNPAVGSCIGRPLEASRAHNTTKEQIQAFFDLFERIQKQYNILPENIWNVDETGIAVGVCANSIVLGKAGKRRTYIQSPENREWVSIVEAISAKGRTIRPLIIFKGQSLQSTWFTAENVPDWVYTTSENGWTSNNHAFNWLQRIFIPETAPTPPAPRLLVLDGHGSHISVDFLWNCKQNNIFCVFFPAHTSHLLQPLDLCPFAQLKDRYRRAIAELASLDDAAPVKKERFISCYQLARNERLTPKNIKAGWKATGIYPWNPRKALSSSQLVNSQEEIVKTPQSAQEQLISTPKRAKDLYAAMEGLADLSRECRLLLRKAGKALEEKAVYTAQLETELASCKAKLGSLENNRKRKRVVHDPNTKFAEINAIKAAIEKAEIEQQLAARRDREGEARRTAEAVVQANMEDFMFEWQI